jgi:transposase
MEVVHARCAGLDVHKKLVVACVLTPDTVGADGQPKPVLRRFGTMTAELQELAAWLAEQGVKQVAMESTGVLWQPVWNILEEVEVFELVLVNAHHIKTVPGRKTDIKDAQWLAELLRHGLVRGSFVPDRAQRELRELTRYRTSLIEERVDHVNRLQKTLETANIKLSAVVSDVTGVSARAMLRELAAGRTDAEELAELAVGRLRDKLPALQQALAGRFGAHHQYLVPRILATIDYLDSAIADLDTQIAERERPFEDAVERLDEIPGVGRRVAETVIAEVGATVDRFPSAQHLASWAGLCPGNHESAGKRLSGKTRKGNAALRRGLVQAAHAAGRSRRTYLGAQYRRLAARRGKKRAAVAVAHSILVIAYHLLANQTSYADLGPDFFERRKTDDIEQQLVRKLERLGNEVTLKKVSKVA